MNVPDQSTFDFLRGLIASDHGVDVDTLTPDYPLSSLTIDSLGVVELIYTLEDHFGVVAENLPSDFTNLGSIANYIDGLRFAGSTASTEQNEIA